MFYIYMHLTLQSQFSFELNFLLMWNSTWYFSRSHTIFPIWRRDNPFGDFNLILIDENQILGKSFFFLFIFVPSRPTHSYSLPTFILNLIPGLNKVLQKYNKSLLCLKKVNYLVCTIYVKDIPPIHLYVL